MTRKQAILSIEGGYYCFVLAYGINLCKVSLSSEYVCIKSVVLLCLLKWSSSLLSIVEELITTLLLNSFPFQQGSIQAVDTEGT